MALGDFLNKAKEAADNIKNAAKDAAVRQALINEEEIAELNKATNVGTDKLKAIFNEICNASDLISEAGYELDEIEVELSVPPKLIPHFIFKETISEEKRQELLTRTCDKKLMNLLLKSLFKASALQSSLRMGTYQMFEVEIEIGIIPAVKLKFNKQVSTNQNLLSNG